MATRSDTLASSRLRRLARRPPAAEATPPPGDRRAREDEQVPEERCDLCSTPIPSEHRHLVDVETRALICACTACKILFDRPQASDGHYRLVPDRRLCIQDFMLDDATWEALRIPVEMAFFFHSTPAERVAAFYPGPMGATESLLELDAWRDLEETNPILLEMEPDVEALLVNRAKGARQHWIAPIDDCYELVGAIRTRWKGLAGGQEVWEEIERFFGRLARRAKTASRVGTGQEARSPATSVAGDGEEATWRPT